MEAPERLLADARLERLYRALVDEDDAGSCRDIDERACRVVPGNFLLLLLTQFLTRLGDAIASPKTVLAWLLNALGAPALFTALLVPVRESGSLVPQLVIASYVRARPLRKWSFVAGSILQGAAVLGMALVAVTLTGTAAGLGLVGALLLFSLARGLCSVASKDMLGKTVPGRRRGQLGGWATALAGLVTIAVGVFVLLERREPGDTGTWLLLLAIAAGLWLLAAATCALLREYPGETGDGANPLREALARLGLLRSDRGFRRFVIARSLLLCSALSAPFFVALAHENTAGAAAALGLFIIADGLASLLSGPFWGRLADRSSRLVMAAAGAGAALAGLALAATVTLLPAAASTAWLYPCFYFLLAMAHAGVRIGRKTWIVDLASGNRRTDYVAVSNTAIGLVLLLAGAVGALATVLSTAGVIVILAGMGLAGAALSTGLREVT